MITSVRLHNFRCFDDFTIRSDVCTILCGNNGVGKTSILEALYYACYGTSFRTRTPHDLSKNGDGEFFIAAQGSTHEVAWNIHAGFSHGRKRVSRDGSRVSQLSSIFSCLQVVCVHEGSMALITGGPEERRNFLDQCLTLTDQDYVCKLRHYRAVLRQRNAFLSQKQNDRALYTYWTEQLRDAGEALRSKRRAMLSLLMEAMQKLAQFYFPAYDNISASYEVRDRDVSRQQEMAYGRTLFGAHRDDVVVFLGGVSVRRFASRGQQKCVMLLFKLAQSKLLGGGVTFLFDDVLFEFDISHIRAALAVVERLSEQVFMAHAGEIPDGCKSIDLMKRGVYICL